MSVQTAVRHRKSHNVSKVSSFSPNAAPIQITELRSGLLGGHHSGECVEWLVSHAAPLQIMELRSGLLGGRHSVSVWNGSWNKAKCFQTQGFHCWTCAVSWHSPPMVLPFLWKPHRWFSTRIKLSPTISRQIIFSTKSNGQPVCFAEVML